MQGPGVAPSVKFSLEATTILGRFEDFEEPIPLRSNGSFLPLRQFITAP